MSRANTVARVGLILLLMGGGGASLASEQRYDYDVLGRLIRSVSAEGGQTEYIYDAAGNLLQVKSGAIQPPTISTSDVGSFRRNEFRPATISGANLAGTSLRPTHPGISISNIVSSATRINFLVSVASDTPLGPHQLLVESAAGSATVGLTVLEGALLTIEPQPIVVPPDNLARKYIVRLPDPAIQNVTIGLSTHAPNIAKSNLASVTIPAGQTTAEIGVIGVTAGTTVLTLSYANWIQPIEAIVKVAAGASNQLVYGRPVGITRFMPWSVSPNLQSISKSVGIVRHVPWAFNPNNTTLSKSVGITRLFPWAYASDSGTISKSVGIVFGSPYPQSVQRLIVSPPVGLTRP